MQHANGLSTFNNFIILDTDKRMDLLAIAAQLLGYAFCTTGKAYCICERFGNCICKNMKRAKSVLYSESALCLDQQTKTLIYKSTIMYQYTKAYKNQNAFLEALQEMCVGLH
jgi:hypothetical protein